MNNLLNTEKESYSFPKLLFHFDFVYSPNFSPHMGKKCLMCTSLLGEKKSLFNQSRLLSWRNPFPMDTGIPRAEVLSPRRDGSPAHLSAGAGILEV